MSDANKALARRVIEETVNKGNFGVLDEVIASDYTYYEPTVGEVRGQDGFKGLITMYRNAFPDVTLTIDEQIAEGDTVVTRWTGRGTHRGELMGVAPTGKPVSVKGVIVSRFKKGKLVQDIEHWDVFGLMQQLGVVKALPKAVPKAA
jgi:steroid delta-isomerase-like uncharacterized protein